jgi:hypothetical protein
MAASRQIRARQRARYAAGACVSERTLRGMCGWPLCGSSGRYAAIQLGAMIGWFVRQDRRYASGLEEP